MTEQKIEAVEDDGDDVVIIGDVMPKPMTSHDQKKPRRHVEFKKSKYKKESLVITQKVKVKKQKYQCILRKINVNDSCSTQESGKKNNISVTGSSEVKDKCERYTPVCLRKTCKDSRCKFESKSGKTNERRRTNRRHHCDFPRDLKRMLSPVSPSPLERDLSFDLELSLDTSSLQEMTESKLDTLIKRTRDRDRKNNMARTQYLFTPPQTEIPNDDITGDIKMSDTTDYKPPYTSTPKYEENDDKTSSIASNHNVVDQSKTNNNPSLEDIQLMFSPIRNPNAVPVSINVSSKDEGSQCFSSLLKDTNIQDINSESVNAATSNSNYEQNIPDETDRISNIKVQVNEGNILDMQIINKKSEHVHPDVTNINHEQSIFSNGMPTCNNTKQSILCQQPFLEEKQIQHNTSEYIPPIVSNNHDQNVKDQTNKTFSKSLEKIQIVHKKSEYTQTENLDTDLELNSTDTRMLVSSSIVESPNKSTCSEQLQTQHQSCDIQTIVNNTNELLIDDGTKAICNNDYVPSIENPLSKDVQDKKSTLQHNEINTENKNIPINNNLITTEHTSFFGDIQAQHRELPDTQTAISKNSIADSRMTLSYSNNNAKKQACKPNSLFNYNMQNKIDEHANSINFNTNYDQNTEEIDMSISYDDDNNDNVADQLIPHRLTYEDAHLQHKQSEYYLHTAVDNTNYVNNNDFIRTDDFHSNFKQNAENSQMSVSYNNFIDQPNTYRSLFVDDKHVQQKPHTYYEQNNTFTQQLQRDSESFDKDIHTQDLKFNTHSDINYADCNKYYRQTNDVRENPSFYNDYTEKRNRSISPFFEDYYPHKQFEINYSYRKQKQNKYRKMSISDDINFKEQQNRAFFENINKEHKENVNTFTDYSNKEYEQTRNGCDPISFDNNFKEKVNQPYFEKRHHNIPYNYSGRDQEQIGNMSISYDNSSSNEHKNRSESRFSINLHEQQRKSDYIRTSYFRNFKESARSRSQFFDRVYSQQKKYKHMHTDDSRKTYEQNIDDRNTSTTYKNDNFREILFKRHNPFSYESRHNKYKYMHTHDSNKYYEQRVEERNISITNKNTYSDKRNRGFNARVEERHQYLQHRKFVYNAVSKKKVEISVDKRMSDEAYEDVLVGLPPGQVSPDYP